MSHDRPEATTHRETSFQDFKLLNSEILKYFNFRAQNVDPAMGSTPANPANGSERDPNQGENKQFVSLLCLFAAWLVCVLLNKPEGRLEAIRGMWHQSFEDSLFTRWAAALTPVASHCWLCYFCFRLNLKHFSIRLRLMTIIRRVGAPSDRAVCSDNALGGARHNGNPALRCKNEGASQRLHAFTFYQ